MHDGSMNTLDEVLDHYMRGGRLITDRPYIGDGKENPYKDLLITGFSLRANERQDLIAFLHALTDETFLNDSQMTSVY